MSPFYFKFQFRNVEYSSGRNKTLLCFRVDTPGGSTEPLKGYMEDEHATAHAEEAFFQQVILTCQVNVLNIAALISISSKHFIVTSRYM